jgi:hypothetical protein
LCVWFSGNGERIFLWTAVDKIREEVGEQIIEDALYGKDYIKWRKGEEQRREKDWERELLKQKRTSTSSSSDLSSPIPLPSFSSPSSLSSSSLFSSFFHI